MNMSWFQSLIMGFVSGLAEMLPISAEAHRSILRNLFGVEREDPVFALLVHLASLLVLVWDCREDIYRLRRAKRQISSRSRRRRSPPDMPTVYTIRLLRTAAVLLVIGKLFTPALSFMADRLELLALVLITNGALLYIPCLLPTGNKDSRNMPRVDSMLMGLGAGLSVVPGISQVGAVVSIGSMRGVDRKYALRFAYLLLMVGLGIQAVFDVVAITAGVAFSGIGFAIALLGAVFAGVGAKAGIHVMRFLSFQTGYSGFAYYCWGAALVSLILYLIV